MRTPLALISIALISIGLGVAIQATPIPQTDTSEQKIALTATTSWSDYNSENGRFIAQFPGQPEAQTRNVPIDGHSTDWNISTFKNEGEVYTVAYTDLESEVIQLGADVVIESIKNNLETDFQWSALNGNGRTISVNGYPAREIIGIGNNKISLVRLIIADQRLYVVMVTSENLANIDQFLQSFAVQTWQPYLWEAGRVQIDFPTSPAEEKESKEFAGKLLNWNLIEARNFTNPNESYSVGYADLQPDDLKNGPDALLTEVSENLLAKLAEKTAITNWREITSDGSSGRSFMAVMDDEQIFMLNFYLVDKRLYGIGVISDDISNINHFLNSFEVQ
jgi:hypothetical protein